LRLKRTLCFIVSVVIFVLPLYGNLIVHFIDVGQGDAILIQTPQGKTILIDGGPYDRVTQFMDYLKSVPVEKLDMVVVTHPHSDHLSGLVPAFQQYRVDQVYMTRATHTISIYRELLLAVQREGLKIQIAQAGVTVDVEDGLSFRFLGPVRDDYDSLNDWSAVIWLTYGDISFLLMGDAEERAEKEIMSRTRNLQANVLKIGHHGSYRASSDTFIKTVDPDYAVIMCAKANDYGYPHRETLVTLKKYDVTLYRTDLDGTIRFETDGKQLAVYTEKGAALAQPVVFTGVYIGNKNSKVFHLPTCTGLPEEANRVYFNTREEAIAAGYRPCGGCQP